MDSPIKKSAVPYFQRLGRLCRGAARAARYGEAFEARCVISEVLNVLNRIRVEEPSLFEPMTVTPDTSILEGEE